LFAIQGSLTSCLQSIAAILIGGVLLAAADPAWKTKPASKWTEDDSKQVLSDSPWAKIVKATIVRKQSEDERRAGGNMGDAKGIGYDGLQKEKVIVPKSIVDLLKPEPKAPPRPQLPVLVRWESAIAVRMAELKGGTFEPPTLEGDGYKVAVYGIPTANVKGDPKVLGEPLKDNAFLRREGKNDVKPISVEVFQQEDSMVAVYLFPLSAEINRKDMSVEFGALIGRISVVESFNVQLMQFEGKLDL
jgi:hypothetical protein